MYFMVKRIICKNLFSFFKNFIREVIFYFFYFVDEYIKVNRFSNLIKFKL